MNTITYKHTVAQRIVHMLATFEEISIFQATKSPDQKVIGGGQKAFYPCYINLLTLCYLVKNLWSYAQFILTAHVDNTLTCMQEYKNAIRKGQKKPKLTPA